MSGLIYIIIYIIIIIIIIIVVCVQLTYLFCSISWFYEEDDDDDYYLGCADFVPSNLDPGSQFAVPMFECFDEVLRKASSWVRHQRRVRITNVQSIDYKLKHDYGTDSDTLGYKMPLYIRPMICWSVFKTDHECDRKKCWNESITVLHKLVIKGIQFIL